MHPLALALPVLMSLFDTSWTTWSTHLDYARTLQGSPTEISGEPLLSLEDCKKLESKIATQYALNPFHLKIQGGNLKTPICTPRSENALMGETLLSRETLASYYYSREITLSQEGKMIEWKELLTSRKDPTQKLHFHAAIDTADNIYTHYWTDDLKSQKITFISSTGLTPEPWSITEYPDKANPELVRRLLRISLPTAQNWKFVFTPLSFFKVGSVYGYEDSIQRLPTDHIALRIYELNGVRQCAVGAESISGKIRLIPEDFAIYSKCIVQ